MKAINIVVLICGMFIGTKSIAQVANCAPPSSTTYLEINNVRALIKSGGTIWNDTSPNVTAFYEAPKNSGRNLSLNSKVLFSGKDINNNILAAGDDYGMRTGFWPGPLNNMGQTDSLTCKTWDKVYSVLGEEIINAKTKTAVSDAILNWPGTIAPFNDLNSNGIYEPLSGEYPVYDLNNSNNIPQQMVWWVFNDKGNQQMAYVGGLPLGLEIQATAFAYASSTNNALNNTTFYRYKIINKSNSTISDFRFSNFIDPDIGCSNDDYIGCDLSRSLFYAYNADSNDEFCGPGLNYGSNPPAFGQLVLKSFKENNTEVGIKNFMFFTPNGSLGIDGDPRNAVELNRYLNGLWADGQPLTYGTASGRGGVDVCNYAFPGNTDPFNRPSWVETSTPGDRRMMASTGLNSFQPGEVQEMVFAMVWARKDSLDLGTSVNKLQLTADTIKSIYSTNFNGFSTGFSSELFSTKVFPNPTTEKLSIELPFAYKNIQVDIITSEGKLKLKTTQVNVRRFNMDVSNLINGVYFLKINADGQIKTLKFIKK